MANQRQRDRSHIEDDNEQRTVQLQFKGQQLKDIAIQIDQETRYQINELRKFHQSMDLNNRLVSQNRRRVTLLSSSSSWKIYWYLMIFALFVFLMIYVFIK